MTESNRSRSRDAGPAVGRPATLVRHGPHRAIIVMGVSGAGKSTLGRGLAERLGYAFIEGDDLHPPANVDKMAAGVPLNDADRRPWLERVAEALAQAAAAGGGVVACSALKRAYRDLIRQGLATPLAIVHPVMAETAARDRLARRRGHYMPVSLLASQFSALEPPGPDERAIIVDASLPVDQQVGLVSAGLASAASAASAAIGRA